VPFANMLPDFIPFKIALVYISGVYELIAGLVLIFNLKFKRLVATSLLLYLFCTLPINIHSSLQGIGIGSEYGPMYLWFRIPLQIFWFWWIWYFVIRKPESSMDPE
jgi:uncharacterized membrane protein